MISVIIPSLDRPNRLIDCLQSLQLHSRGIIEVSVLLDEEDIASRDAVIKYCSDGLSQMIILRIMKGNPTAIDKWNYGAAKSNGQWIMLAADDITFTPDWDTDSLATPNMGFLALRDTIDSKKHFEPHYMATREWLKKHNGGVLAVPYYKHWGPDVEIASRAFKLGHYVTSKAIIPHKHMLFNTAPDDSTYRKGAKSYESDLLLLKARELSGFPDNFEPVLT